MRWAEDVVGRGNTVRRHGKGHGGRAARLNTTIWIGDVEKHLQISGGYGAGFIFMGTTRLPIRLDLRC